MLALVLACPLAAGAGQISHGLCGEAPREDLAEHDRLLSIAAWLKTQLAAHGQPAALVSRAGTRLERFGIRGTHAALALRDNPLAPWAVRQLYFACDERKSRLFDQGLAGFLLGAERGERGYLSIVLLPAEAAEPLAAAALDTPRALALLAPQYTANAHPEDLLRQNCNQWLAELLALGWGGVSAERGAAQAWLREAGYRVAPVDYGWIFWRWAAAFVPWLSFEGHPPEDLAARRLHTSLPPDLEAFAQVRFPAAQRLQLCYTPAHAVLRRGGEALGEACEAGPGDETLAL